MKKSILTLSFAFITMLLNAQIFPYSALSEDDDAVLVEGYSTEFTCLGTEGKISYEFIREKVPNTLSNYYEVYIKILMENPHGLTLSDGVNLKYNLRLNINGDPKKGIKTYSPKQDVVTIKWEDNIEDIGKKIYLGEAWNGDIKDDFEFDVICKSDTRNHMVENLINELQIEHNKTNSKEVQGEFIDKRDGQIYKWVKINGQIWMAENLRYSGGLDSRCIKGSGNSQEYGRLYTFRTAREVCPAGWGLPSMEDWEALIEELQLNDTLNNNLNSIYAGYIWYNSIDNEFTESGLNKFSSFHTSTFKEEEEVIDESVFTHLKPYYINIQTSNNTKIKNGYEDFNTYRSVRCIKGRGVNFKVENPFETYSKDELENYIVSKIKKCQKSNIKIPIKNKLGTFYFQHFTYDIKIENGFLKYTDKLFYPLTGENQHIKKYKTDLRTYAKIDKWFENEETWISIKTENSEVYMTSSSYTGDYWGNAKFIIDLNCENNLVEDLNLALRQYKKTLNNPGLNGTNNSNSNNISESEEEYDFSGEWYWHSDNDKEIAVRLSKSNGNYIFRDYANYSPYQELHFTKNKKNEYICPYGDDYMVIRFLSNDYFISFLKQYENDNAKHGKYYRK